MFWHGMCEKIIGQAMGCWLSLKHFRIFILMQPAGLLRCLMPKF